mmetsp:Transcript_9664/g.21553  ORF Transcript_9664/g.21553 Transcript_9664/m.21553 type:complete len:329 (+) Transcript_9664:816-1802(+)
MPRALNRGRSTTQPTGFKRDCACGRRWRRCLGYKRRRAAHLRRCSSALQQRHGARVNLLRGRRPSRSSRSDSCRSFVRCLQISVELVGFLSRRLYGLLSGGHFQEVLIGSVDQRWVPIRSSPGLRDVLHELRLLLLKLLILLAKQLLLRSQGRVLAAVGLGQQCGLILNALLSNSAQIPLTVHGSACEVHRALQLCFGLRLLPGTLLQSGLVAVRIGEQLRAPQGRLQLLLLHEAVPGHVCGMVCGCLQLAKGFLDLQILPCQLVLLVENGPLLLQCLLVLRREHELHKVWVCEGLEKSPLLSCVHVPLPGDDVPTRRRLGGIGCLRS